MPSANRVDPLVQLRIGGKSVRKDLAVRMNHRRISFASMALSLWCAVAAAQTPSASALPATLQAHLKNERLDIVTSVRGLPLGVRDALQTLFGSQPLDLAEPGAEFQLTDVPHNSKLPSRRMVAAGCATDHCLVYYERGGVAHTWYVALFHWTPKKTRFEWGGTAPSNLATIHDVHRAVLSGRIKGSNKTW